MKTTIPLTQIPAHQPGTTSPMAMLRHEHEVILRALALLEHVGGRLESGQPVNRQALGWLIEFFRTFADRCHHGKEEQHLFPALERHGLPKDSGPLGVMLHEHTEGRAFVRAIAEGDDATAAWAIRHYAALLRAHIDKENNVLFPLAEQVLPEEEQHALLSAFEEVEQAVAGPVVHERLLAELARLEES